MKPKSSLSEKAAPGSIRLGLACAVAIAVSFVSSAGFAADFGDRTPSVNELINALNAKPGKGPHDDVAARPDGVRTRGLKIVATESAASSATDDGKAAPAGNGKVSMSIQFELNSDRVQRPSADSLSNLATALNSDALKGKRFEVIGHTDTSGSPTYNYRLSERRARSVAEFLSTVGVEPARAKTAGRGPSEPLESLSPTAAQQRRVEIRMME